MALTAGTVSTVSVSDRLVQLLATAATAGTAPVTYQWYKSVVSGFSPGGGNIIAGATALALNDSAVIPGTQYYYKLQASDASPTTVTYTQQAVLTSQPTLSPNQFTEAPFLGMLDLRFNPDTIAVEFDPAGSGSLYAGQLVKFTQVVGGIPKVVPITANTDEVAGMIAYDIKTKVFLPGDKMEMSMSQNVGYMYATGAIARGAQVAPDITTAGGVKVPVTGDNLIGWAIDVATAPGQLIRIKLNSPSYAFAP